MKAALFIPFHLYLQKPPYYSSVCAYIRARASVLAHAFILGHLSALLLLAWVIVQKRSKSGLKTTIFPMSGGWSRGQKKGVWKGVKRCSKWGKKPLFLCIGVTNGVTNGVTKSRNRPPRKHPYKKPKESEYPPQWVKKCTNKIGILYRKSCENTPLWVVFCE